MLKKCHNKSNKKHHLYTNIPWNTDWYYLIDNVIKMIVKAAEIAISDTTVYILKHDPL